MPDKVSKKIRSRTMKAVRSKNTSLEILVSKTLWKRNFRFRKNVNALYGSPDIAIRKYKVVVFIDSCFWHGCSHHFRMPSTNTNYWQNKIGKNKNRDVEVTKHYLKKQWGILRIWEHEIKDDFESSIQKIIDFISNAKNRDKY